MPVSSRIPGFKDLSPRERRSVVANRTALAESVFASLDPNNGLSVEQADHMVENVVGVIGIPVGIATNVMVNDSEYLVPMATEE
ncbi:MAG: 3-hydroxy-3-methylglutaryl-CoA reductase, partial [Rhodococcus sp. (in: high G+C Gram-positive bacteria)]